MSSDIRFGNYLLRARQRDLVGPDGPVVINSRVYDLLTTFLSQPNEVLGKSELLDGVWGDVAVEENTLQVHISALRKALAPDMIVTVHGRGYKYAGPQPETVTAAATAPTTEATPTGNIDRYDLDCVARDGEAAAVRELLAQHRLVSLVGPGGVGKTTLAIAIAAEQAEAMANGVWVIDLATLQSGEFLESALIQTLGVRFRAGGAPLESIVDHLRKSEALLVLDNCEHVLSEVARAAKAILTGAPRVRMLATSQLPLGIAGEHIYRLMPFALGGSEAQSVQFLAHCYATFGAQVSPRELPAMERICQRLDGMALGLKMVAARASSIGLEAVDRQLEQQLGELSADWDPTLPRHRSLGTLMEWSYGLLDESDQRVLRVLGVFHGSFSIDAVTALAGDGASAALGRLVRRSLVVRDAADPGRYRLLDTTRQFALAKLDELGEETEIRRRHARFITELFEASIASWETIPDHDWEAIYRPEGGNLRAALAFARAEDDWTTYFRIASSTYRYYMQEQLGDEGLATMEAALPFTTRVEPELAARLQLSLAQIARFGAMDSKARPALKAALDWYGDGHDPLRLCQILVIEGWIQLFAAEPSLEAVIARLEVTIAELPPCKVKAWALVCIGMYRWTRGDRETGLARAEAGLAMHIAMGNPSGRFRSVMNLAELLHQGGDTEGALRISLEHVTAMRHEPDTFLAGIVIGNIAAYYLSLARTEEARRALADAVRLTRLDGGFWYWAVVQLAAELHHIDGASPVAAMLLGFCDKAYGGWPEGRQPTEQEQRDRLMRGLEAALPADELKRYLQQGAAMSVFEVNHLAGFA